MLDKEAPPFFHLLRLTIRQAHFLLKTDNLQLPPFEEKIDNHGRNGNEDELFDHVDISQKDPAA
ncbi:MAG: hypothetical protein ACP5SH_17770 [Syntrophobacteraceae bacterium]